MCNPDLQGPAAIVEEEVADHRPIAEGARQAHNLRSVCFYLFVLGGIAGLVQLSSPLPFGSGYEMVAIGKSLATTGSFSNPFRILETGPTAVNPPLYPFFLGILFTLFDSPAFVLVVAAIGNVVMNALSASLLPRLSVALFGSIAPGVVAAILWLAAVQLMPAWDASYTVAGLIMFCWYSASTVGVTRPVRAVVLSALLAAALVLLNPSSLIVLAPWLAYLVLIRPEDWKRSVLFAGVVLALLCVPVSLWVLRNWIVLGAPVLRTNLGMTLYVSNNDCAQPSLLETGRVGCYQKHHPNDSVRETQVLRWQGEVAYDKMRVSDSISWMRSNPVRFRHLTIQRLRHFWFPEPGRTGFPIYAIWFGTALSLPGLVLMVWRRETLSIFILFVLLVYPLMYYIVVADVRYRYPVLWLSFLTAGYLIHYIGPHRALRQALRRRAMSARATLEAHTC